MNSQSASSLPSLTLQLSTLVGALCFEHLPKPVIHWASRAIADTIACALAGTNEDSPAMLASILPRTEGQSLVLGGRERMHMLDAAQRNGAAAHTLDFDDCNLVMDGHPSVSIIPALLALADELDCSGSAFLTAYVAGIEAEIRIAALSNPAHVDRGWHPTVTFGVLGCAIACARLLQLEPQAIARAIAIAASSAAGLRANSGTMTKPLHAAMANRNGLQAALLAQKGFTANAGVLEHKLGYMAAFNGEIPQAFASVLADWGQTFAVLEPGIAIKQYPCCAFVHCAIDAAAELHRGLNGAVADIAAIAVHLHRRRLKNIDRPVPKDGLDARFSTQYLTARALVSGTVRFADFEAGRLNDAEVAALAAKVILVPHEDDDLSMGRVEITLRDGRDLQAQTSVAMGRGPANPMTEAQFAQKFHDCAGRLLPGPTVTRLQAALLTLPAQTSMRSLTQIMELPVNQATPAVASAIG